MGLVYFFSIPLFGHVNYGLKLAKAMKANNHKVLYFSGLAYKDYILNKGVDFAAYSNDIEKQFEIKGTSYDKEYMSSIRPEKQDQMEEWYRYCFHLYSVLDIFLNNDILLYEKPDLIVYDSAALWGMHIAKYYNVPCVSSCTPYTIPREILDNDPTVFSKYILKAEMDKKTASRRISIMNKYLADSFKNQFACSLFDPISPVAKNKIIYTIRNFQMYEESFGTDVFFSGISLDDDDRSSIDYLIAESESPIIYISFGTIYNNLDVYCQLIERLKNVKCSFILNVGDISDISLLNNLPSNWKVVNRINQIGILSKVDLFISHGGVNSVREAAHLGTPILVIPTEGDTFFTAEDVLRTGVGKVVGIDGLDELEDTVYYLLSDLGVKHACECLSRQMLEAPGLPGAVNYLETIMCNNK